MRHRGIRGRDEFSKSSGNLDCSPSLILGQRVAIIEHDRAASASKDITLQLWIDFPGEKNSVPNGPAVLHRGSEFPHLRTAQHKHVGHSLWYRDKSGALDGARFR